MKVISTWTIRPGAIPEVVDRFLAGKAEPTAGVKVLGRWHSIDLSGGVSLYEVDDPAALHAYLAPWAALMESKVSVVIEDSEAAASFVKAYRK